MRQQKRKRAEKTLNMLVIALLDTIVNVNRTTIVVELPQMPVGPLCALRKRPDTPEYGL
jgi:hypothetical protein